jgi:hypothetical protein
MQRMARVQRANMERVESKRLGDGLPTAHWLALGFVKAQLLLERWALRVMGLMVPQKPPELGCASAHLLRR